MVRNLLILKIGIICLLSVAWWVSEIGSAEEALSESVTYEPVWTFGQSPVISGVSYVVIDTQTKAVILAQQEDKIRPLASVTKLLAACGLRRETDLRQSKVIMSERDLLAPGQAGRLSVGEAYTLYDLLFPLLLESSNDAAEAIFRIQGDSLSSINEHFRTNEIKLSDFSGLSDFNQGSAWGVASSVADCLSDDRHLFDITRLKTRAGDYVAWSNNSPVIAEDYRGGKHGYTEAASRTLTAVFSEKTLPLGLERELIYVILGSDNLALDLERLRFAVTSTARFE